MARHSALILCPDQSSHLKSAPTSIMADWCFKSTHRLILPPTTRVFWSALLLLAFTLLAIVLRSLLSPYLEEPALEFAPAGERLRRAMLLSRRVVIRDLSRLGSNGGLFPSAVTSLRQRISASSRHLVSYRWIGTLQIHGGSWSTTGCHRTAVACCSVAGYR